jgi:gustatory receptor
MSTIYAITGAITSYLIILIQFNLAAIRAKPTITSNVTETTTETFLNITNIATIMPPIVETVRP